MHNRMDEYKSLLEQTIIRGDASPENINFLLRPLYNLIFKMCPQTLFRYRTCSDLNFDSLLNDKIYFNAPRNFNDPHDCLPYTESDEKMPETIFKMPSEERKNNLLRMIETLKTGNPLSLVNSDPIVNHIRNLLPNQPEDILNQCAQDPELILNLLKSYILQNKNENKKLLREQTFVACMSETIDSTLMWAHYADDHKGFALAYEKNELYKLERMCPECEKNCLFNNRLFLLPVIYGEDRVDATGYGRETLLYHLSRIYGLPQKHFCVPDILFNVKVDSYKGTCWEYEREWRLIFTCLAHQPSHKSLSLKPKAIYLGSQISNINKQIIKKLVEDKDIQIYEMYVDEQNRKYTLNYRPIS